MPLWERFKDLLRPRFGLVICINHLIELARLPFHAIVLGVLQYTFVPHVKSSTGQKSNRFVGVFRIIFGLMSSFENPGPANGLRPRPRHQLPLNLAPFCATLRSSAWHSGGVTATSSRTAWDPIMTTHHHRFVASLATTSIRCWTTSNSMTWSSTSPVGCHWRDPIGSTCC